MLHKALNRLWPRPFFYEGIKEKRQSIVHLTQVISVQIEELEDKEHFVELHLTYLRN
jgi:hypothetical protein